MEARIPARLTAAEGRRFGLVVGAAFLVLAGLSAWRGHQLPPRILGGIGALLIVGGLLAPAHMGPVHAAWMKLALVISRVTTPIFMGIVYYVVLTPMAMVRRAFGGNPMRRTASGGSYWMKHATSADKDAMLRQF